MEYTELISVIIPVYKVEKYINKCVQSVVDQTYKNLEIILVDDGSPDNCPKICDNWEKIDSRIKVIHKANGGLSDARNAGMSIATGKYIGFVDSDDYIDIRMYEYLYNAIKNEKAEIAICDYEIVTENGEIIDEQSPVKNETFSGVTGLKKISEQYGWRYVTAWNKLYKMEIFDGIEFPKGKIHEDEFVIHELFFRCKKIATISKKLYKYLQRDGSITKQKINVQHLDIVEALCCRSDFYEQKELSGLNEDLYKSIKSVYDSRRIQLSETQGTKERKRVKEIDILFKKKYLSNVDSVSLSNKLKYTFPIIWFTLCRIMWLKKARKIIKKYSKRIIIEFFSRFPRKWYDNLKKHLPSKTCRDIDKERIRKFGFKLIKSPEKYYNKIVSNHKIMEIYEGNYSYLYFNVCYLNNVINLILYALYEGCIPVIKINDDKEDCNKWSWYFKQPVEILCEDSSYIADCEVVTCDTKDSLFHSSFEEGFYPYSKNYPIWSYLNKKFVVFNEKTHAYIEEEKEKIITQKTLGVLLRGTDYTSLQPFGHPIQPDAEDIVKYAENLMKEKEYQKVYVATEEKRLFEKVVSVVGRENVLSNKRTYYDDVYYKQKHKLIGEIKFDRENDNYVKGLEYLSSLEILASCSGIVAGNCGGSMYALLNAENYQDIYIYNKGYYK